MAIVGHVEWLYDNTIMAWQDASWSVSAPRLNCAEQSYYERKLIIVDRMHGNRLNGSNPDAAEFKRLLSFGNCRTSITS